MTSLHRRLRKRLDLAVPREWRCGTEVCGHWVDRSALWRADVMAWKGTCAVALEAQLQADTISRRSDAYLKVGVWPLWFFIRVPGFLKDAAVCTETDIPRVPFILEAIAGLPDPTGAAWIDTQPALHAVLAAARAEIPSSPPPLDEILRRRRESRRSRKARDELRGYLAGYEEGKAAGWADANERFKAALRDSR